MPEFNSSDFDEALNVWAQPYLESLLDALNELIEDEVLDSDAISNHGRCVTVEWPDADYALTLAVAIVVEQGRYEFECHGPEFYMSGQFLLESQRSIEWIVALVTDVTIRNLVERCRSDRATKHHLPSRTCLRHRFG